MSTDQSKAMVRRYLHAISGKEKPRSLLTQYIAEADQALFEHINAAESAFPCYELTAEDMFAEMDKVAVRFIWRGVHRSEFMGISATGRQVAVPGIIIYRIADGKIADHWLQVDSVTLMQQLGVQQ